MGRGRLPWGGEEDEALQEPSRVHIALLTVPWRQEHLQLGDPSAVCPHASRAGARLKGRRSETLHQRTGCAWIPLCWQGEGILSRILHGDRRGPSQGLVPPGCRGVSACTPLCAQNGFLLSLKQTRIISQLLSTLSINDDNVVKPH